VQKKFFINGEVLRSKAVSASKKICGPVASTMGPAGKTVILHTKDGEPFITKDGVTVAKFLDNISEDDFENAIIKIIKQAATATNSSCGDGTTTATVLADAILTNSQKYLALGMSAREIKIGIEKAVAHILKNLSEMSTKVVSLDNIKNVATISANGDTTIGELVMTAVDAVGKDGAITIEDAKSFQTTLEIVDGFRIESGYLAQAFVTDQKRGVAKLVNPLVLVTDEHVSLVDQILPALEIAAKDSSSLLIIADEIESNSQALAALILNMVRGTMKVVAINAPKYGEEKRGILKDVALSTGATLITREEGLQLKDVEVKHLGRANKVEISKIETIIVGGSGDQEKINERIELLKQELKQAEEEHICLALQNRITKLSSGAAIIKIGGTTEVEATEKLHRVQDALEAVKSSIEEGILPGGGVALIRAGKNLQKIKVDNESQKAGVQIIAAAIEEPFKTIAKNANMPAEVCLGKVKLKRGDEGYNFATKKFVSSVVKEGIIDPTKVTKFALINAVSAASTLITADYAIVEK